MHQDGLTTKVRGGKPCSADRVNAESVNDAHHIEQFEANVMWRIREMGDVIYTESDGKEMISYENLANWDEWQFPLCSQTGDQNFLVTSDKKIQNITSNEKAPTVTVLTAQIGTTPITPGLIIVADPKLKEGDVDTFVDGCNPENSAFRVMATNNGWVNPAAKREFLRVLIESDQNSFGKKRILFFYDGHFTNHDYELLKLCWAHDLVPMVLPPHLTHLMNPMDMRKGVISELKKRITSVVSKEMRLKVTESRGGQNIERISKKELAGLATRAFKEYVNDPKTKSDLACALRSCGFFEQGRDTALRNCANGKETVPLMLIYLVTQSSLAKHLFEDSTTGSKQSTNKKEKINFSSIEPICVRMVGEVMGKNSWNSSKPEVPHRSVGGSDYTNSSTADAENARRRANNLLFKEKERERIDAKKSRTIPLRKVAKAEKDLEKSRKNLAKLERKETVLQALHASIADAEIPKGYFSTNGVQLPGQPNATADEQTRHAFAAERLVPSAFLKEIGDGEGNVNRNEQQYREKIEKATVKFAREKNKSLKTNAQLDLLAELLIVSLPKDKKEAENLLFGENPPKRWSNESLNQWKTNVLKPAREEVKEKEADLEKAQQVLSNAPAAVQHDLTAQPMLQGEEFTKYDSQDFMRTAAVRAEAYNDRENRLKAFGERLDFGAHDQRLHPEDRAKMFADTLFNEAGRAGVLSNNANENNIARNREDNRRRFEQEPEDAFDASPPGHPHRSLAFDTQFQDEKYQRNLETDLYRLDYNSSEDDDDYSSEDDDDYFSEDDDGLINENTGMSDMLLENEWDFEDDRHKGNDNDDDW